MTDTMTSRNIDLSSWDTLCMPSTCPLTFFDLIILTLPVEVTPRAHAVHVLRVQFDWPFPRVKTINREMETIT